MRISARLERSRGFDPGVLQSRAAARVLAPWGSFPVSGVESSSAPGSSLQPWVVFVVVTVAVVGSLGIAFIPARPVILGGCPAPDASPAASPVKHLFVIIQENHAFENYFGDFPGVLGYPPNGSLPATFSGSATVSPFPILSNSTSDLPHDRNSSLVDWDGGQNDFFVAEAASEGAADPSDAVGYYSATQLSAYYGLAREYGLGDRFFSGVLGPTWPNRVFDITAYSGGGWYSDSPPPENVTSQPTILGQLTDAGIRWAYDFATSSVELAPTWFPALMDNPCSARSLVPVGNLPSQIAGPDAPSVVFVDSSNSPTISEHPPESVVAGESWTVSIIDSILASPVGPSSLILLFYDESGGFWDPVSPPMTSTGLDGFRVPFLAISAWTPPNTVCSNVMDPAAVLHFIDENWGLPYLNNRTAQAPGLGCYLNFGAGARSLS